MKKTLLIPAIISALTIIACSTDQSLIKQKLSENRTGIFCEYNGGAIPAGKSLLNISASIKTHKTGHHLLESDDSPHGKEVYSFILNIDGQPVVWKVSGTEDNVPLYDHDNKPLREPDAGEGIKYVLNKQIVLNPGQHRVFFSLPDEQYYDSFDIVVQDGKVNELVIKPVYRLLSHSRRWPSFYRGINYFTPCFNGCTLYRN